MVAPVAAKSSQSEIDDVELSTWTKILRIQWVCIIVALFPYSSSVIGQTAEPRSLVFELDPEGDEDGNLMRSVIITLNERLNSSSQATALNNQILRIDVPADAKIDWDSITRLVTTIGTIEFRLLANAVGDKEIVDQALLLSSDQRIVKIKGREVAEWMPYSNGECAPVDLSDNRAVIRLVGKVPQVLLLISDKPIGGEYLVAANSRPSKEGCSQLGFTLNNEGNKLLAQLIGSHQSGPSPRFLGMLLENRLLSIVKSEMISKEKGGMSFEIPNDEAELAIAIVLSGILPCRIVEVFEPADAD
ncbi:hypothetical protein [Bythopirellula goksoeyrii]|uniref:Preprotein translocase subunit SecD n=1 Tax=Bythopirellula goksoeyrii TaxID=1400387 RepID=A0A5B9QHA9_9BACT|nr:hypothetical protein [Bythopirellula goksoeyrii]QEG37012.1 hypothetical protein Pr1d_43520 [Bythopirellula goksoeyrii]